MDSFRWTASAEYLSEYSDGQLQRQLHIYSFSCVLKYLLEMDSFRWTASAEYLIEYSDGQLQIDSFT